MYLLAIDFEASCLPRHGRSFPIEVGVADAAGRMQSWLIQPERKWAEWTWTREAESLHRISRDRLAHEGRPASAIMVALNAAAQGHRVVADHYLDGQWLETLSDAAGVPATFSIGHISELLDAWQPGPLEVDNAMAIANARVPARHRAGSDALWLATFAAAIEPCAAANSPFDWACAPADNRYQLASSAA